MTEAATSVAVKSGVIALGLYEISKSFGQTLALNKASLAVRTGSIHALLGENGAGKTTLMRIAFGMTRPDSGSISVNGRGIDLASPSDAIKAGIGMVHQQFSLVSEMTVAENVALGGRGIFSKSNVATRIAEVSTMMGMRLDPFSKVATLTSAERQKLEIIRSFAHDVAILILDEPTAVLTPADVGDLFAQLKAFASRGGSVVLITHKLRDAIDNADDVTVLRRGRCVLTSPMSLVDHATLANAMLGSASVVARSMTPGSDENADVVLELADASYRDDRGTVRLDRASLQIRAREIVGIAALDGAARHMLRIMAGRLEPTSGRINRPDKIGFVPEERQAEAIIPEFTLVDNTALANAATRMGMIDWHEMKNETIGTLRDYEVRAPGPCVLASALSGGNQQKFVLGRELKHQPSLLVLENPTQGLDVHAANAIHDRIRDAVHGGTAVAIYSSDIDELAVLSSRVIVVSAGRIAATTLDRESIGRALLETPG